MISALLYAFTAGAVAAVNPCGWAMLPAWFARRLDDAGDSMPVIAALRAGVLATAGFILIFGLAGAALALGAVWLGPLMPVAGFGVGIVLAAVGIRELAGLRWSALPGGETCRTVSDRHGSLVFGVGYGLLSLSCTLPIFFAALGVALTGTPVDLALSLLVYALGMGTVLSTLGVVAATTGISLGGLSPRAHAVLRKTGAALLLAAAGYVIFYWGRVVFGDVMIESQIVNGGNWISTALRAWLTSGEGQWATLTALGALVLVSVGYFVILPVARGMRRARTEKESKT